MYLYSHVDAVLVRYFLAVNVCWLIDISSKVSIDVFNALSSCKNDIAFADKTIVLNCL